jgi:hypothetical protein
MCGTKAEIEIQLSLDILDTNLASCWTHQKYPIALDEIPVQSAAGRETSQSVLCQFDPFPNTNPAVELEFGGWNMEEKPWAGSVSVRR